MRNINFTGDEEVDFYLADLASRFPSNAGGGYFLSYSGGRDSHFLYWFIKEYLKDDSIEVVSINTYIEIPEILERIRKNADTILIPELKPFEIKERYGSPCFSKYQDSIIDQYQRGSRAKSLMKAINGVYETQQYNLSKKARTLLLEGKLHRISPNCCKFLKKNPSHKYERETGKRPIIGFRNAESFLRSKRYQKCFSKDGTFHPIYDLSDDMLHRIEKLCNIEVPKVYQEVTRTGCMGCPYGSFMHECEKDLALASDNRRKFLIKYFGESYDVLGVDYKNQQMTIFDMEEDKGGQASHRDSRADKKSRQ